MRPRDILFFLLCTVLLFCPPASAQPDFDTWLRDLRREAAGRGISEATLERALGEVRPLPRVIELDRSQPEFTLTARQYIARVVSEERVRRGRELYGKHRALLERIARSYGVEPHVLVALWGIESDFGRLTGGFRVVDALATLAWDGRRNAFFRQQLFTALEIIEQGEIDADGMTGSWAGAMGQMQFIPSTYRAYAVDFDGDGRRDVWGNTADALASAAHYLREAGWRSGSGWGQEVVLPPRFDAREAGLAIRRTLNEWRRRGIEAEGPGSLALSLLLPDGPEGPAFLVTENFRVLLQWNRSSSFALAVGLLADRIVQGGVEGGAPSDRVKESR